MNNRDYWLLFDLTEKTLNLYEYNKIYYYILFKCVHCLLPLTFRSDIQVLSIWFQMHGHKSLEMQMQQ